MIATAMEAKRLGLSNKSLFVVPNNIMGDFASDFLKLYPSANILMATKRILKSKTAKSSAPESPPGIMTESSSATASLKKSLSPPSASRPC